MMKKVLILFIAVTFALTNYAFARDEQSSLNDNNTVQTKVLPKNQQKYQTQSLMQKSTQPRVEAQKPEQKNLSQQQKITPKTHNSSIGKIPIQPNVQTPTTVDNKLKSTTNSVQKISQQKNSQLKENSQKTITNTQKAVQNAVNTKAQVKVQPLVQKQTTAPKLLKQPSVKLISQPVFHPQSSGLQPQTGVQATPISPQSSQTQVNPPTPLQVKPLPPMPNISIQPPLQVKTSLENQTYKKISLQEAIDYAMCHNLEIISSRMDITKAKNNIKAANALKNPYIQGYYNAGKAAEDNPNFFGMLFPFEIAKRGPRKRLAQSNFQLTRGNVALAELNLRLDVRQAYVDLVATKSILKILGDQRKLLQELLYIAQKKYDAGAVPEMDVIQAKMTLNQILIQENSAKTDVLVARYKFNMMMDSIGFDTKEDYLPEQSDFLFLLTPRPAEKMPEFEKVFCITVNKRLDLRNARQDIDVAQKNLVTVIRQRVPDIEFGGGYIFVPSQLATADRLTQGIYLAGNITNIPLLYQYSPEIKNAKIQVEQKELAYKNLEHHAEMTLHSAYDEFNTSQANLNYYNDILLTESRQFLGMAKRSYMIGKTSITDFIFIEQSYKNIMMGYTKALADYYNAWIEVLREVNDEELKLNG